ncbi:ImmA/IrrE family metallo-endopeptidase [Nonomuraea sp. M3C6]|uniref:ImmA/IrrE family metallo-endopeptidase n=1 Tax=Nonomuraea marmarensis TaxID=3351344 RepID=A0ABW7AI42_9ACTN
MDAVTTGHESASPLGARLRAAREARGLTQQQASAELGVSRPLLIAMEKGSREIRPEELARLARLYGRPVSELLRPSEPPTAVGTRFRAALGMKAQAHDIEAVITDLERICDDYLELARKAGAMLPRRYPALRTLELGSDEAEDLATDERNRLGLGDGPIERLREILENDVGIRVFILPLPPRVAGLFVYAEPLGGCVAVNVNHPPERRRFAMAHEYAHFLVSRDRPEVTLLGRSTRVPEAERFADAFAAAFLMPRSGLARRFHELKRSQGGKTSAATLLQLARAYRVSVQAMTHRLEDLQLIPGGTWDKLVDDKFVPRAGERLPGLGELLDEGESLPQHYRSLAVQLYVQGEITEGQFARFLHTDRVGARDIYRALTSSPDVSDDGSPQIFDLFDPEG